MRESLMPKLRPMVLSPLGGRPLASILVANYNYARFLPGALASALNQTHANLEIIVCDDGSTDNSCEVAERFMRQDSRISLIHQPNGGVASALNAAYGISKGDLIAFLDADDVWMKDRLQKVVAQFQEQPDAGMVTHRLRALDAAGRDCGDFSRGRVYGAGWLAPVLLDGGDPGFPPSSGLTIRREVAERVFPLPAAFRKLADGVTRNRAATLAAVATIDQLLGLYRIHGSNVTGYGRLRSAEAADEAVHLKQLLQQDLAQFAARAHGIDPALMKPADQVRSLVFSKAILRHQNVPRQEIRKHASGLKRWIWTAVFELPAPARARLYQWWCARPLFYQWLKRVSSNTRLSSTRCP